MDHATVHVCYNIHLCLSSISLLVPGPGNKHFTVLLCWAAVETGSFKQQKHYCPTVVEAEVQDRGLVPSEASLLGLQTAIFPLNLHIAFPLLCPYPGFLFFLRGHSHAGLVHACMQA